MTMLGRIILLMTLLITMSAIMAAADDAFTYIDEGDVLPRMKLSRHPAGSDDYLGDDGVISFFAFVKPDHDRSRELFGRIRELTAEFEGRPVRWSFIVSDRSDADSLAAIAAACPSVSVLVDMGDRLYGTIGVSLIPVVGIASASGHLLTYLPYLKIDYTRRIRAHLLLALGDIDADGFTAMTTSSGGIRDTDRAKASRHLKFADMLLKGGKADKARLQVEDALALAPDSPEAYRKLADVLDALAEPAAAAAARSRADSLETGNGSPR